MNGWYTILTGPETGANLRRRARTLHAARRIASDVLCNTGTADAAAVVIVDPTGIDVMGCIPGEHRIGWHEIDPSAVRAMWDTAPSADLAAMMTEAGIVPHEVAGLVAVIEAVLGTKKGKAA